METEQYMLASNPEVSILVFSEDAHRAHTIITHLMHTEEYRPMKLGRKFPEFEERGIALCAKDLVLTPRGNYEEAFLRDELFLSICLYLTEERLVGPYWSKAEGIYDGLTSLLGTLPKSDC